MSDIGKRMRTLREGIGLSQAKFGKIAGIPQATINRYETGYSAAPIKVLIWLCGLLRCVDGLYLLPH